MGLDTDAQQQSLALQKFLATVSHDLSGPLRQIISFSEILDEEEHERLSGDGRTYLRSIISASSRMQDMLTGLLRLARVESRGITFATCELDACVTDTLERLSDEIKRCGAVITRDELPAIDGDHNQLCLLFQEILQNALKFSTNGTPPTIHIRNVPSANPQEITIVIHDNGIGFEPEYATQVFEVFMRLHNPGKYPGTGVGLTLCQAICARHNGSIQAQASPDNGTQISITLPLRQERADQANKAAAQ